MIRQIAGNERRWGLDQQSAGFPLCSLRDRARMSDALFTVNAFCREPVVGSA